MVCVVRPEHIAAGGRAHVREDGFRVGGVLRVDVLHEARAGLTSDRRRVLEAELLHLVDQRLPQHSTADDP